MTRLKNVTSVKRLGILLRTVPLGENVSDAVYPVIFTVIAAINLVQRPAVHLSCQLIAKTIRMARL